MVTIIRPQDQRESMGSAIGKSAGAGIAHGLQQQNDLAFQQKMLNKVMSPVESLLQDRNASPESKLLALAKASVNVPALAELMPLYTQRMMAQGVVSGIGGGSGFGGASQIGGRTPPVQYGNQANQNRYSSQEAPAQQQSAFAPAQQQQSTVPEQQPSPSGNWWQNQNGGSPTPNASPAQSEGRLTPSVKQVMEESLGAYAASGNPAMLQAVPGFYESMNNLQNSEMKVKTEKEKYDLIYDSLFNKYAQEFHQNLQGDDLVNWKLTSRKFSNLPPIERVKATDQAFAKVRDTLHGLDAAYVPGLMKNLLHGPQYRERFLENLKPSVNKLVNMGEEELARQILDARGLTRTEAEGVIRPLDKDQNVALLKLTPGPFGKQKESKTSKTLGTMGTALGGAAGVLGAIYSKTEGAEDKYQKAKEENPELVKTYNEKLTNFLRNNIKPNTSLLVLRDKLYNRKGYDWKQFNEAITGLQQEGFKFDDTQTREFGSLERPPVQSLADIFSDWHQFGNFLLGAR